MIVAATDGCDVHPHCLECPLPACKYDDWRGYRRWLAGRDRACPVCGGALVGRRVTAVYCSVKCQKSSHRLT